MPPADGDSHDILKPLVLAALRRYPLGLSEFDLISEIRKESDILPQSFSGDNLKLFRTHFLLFNSLYRLRRELIALGTQTLEIGPLNIRLRDFREDAPSMALSGAADMKLEAYYLDMRFLDRTGMEDVNDMLDNFWQRFLAQNHRVDALKVLGLDVRADWQEVQRRYRVLAGRHHPDKGGNREHFQKVTAAKETLAICFGKK